MNGELRCPHCRKKFRPIPHPQWRRQRFCTKRCKDLYHTARYYSKNRERYLAYGRAYYARNAEKKRAYQREYDRRRYQLLKGGGSLCKRCGTKFKPNAKPHAHNQKFCSQLCKNRYNRMVWYRRHKAYELEYRARYHAEHLEQCRAYARRYHWDKRAFQSVPDTPTLYD